MPRGGAHDPLERLVGQREVVDHERLEGRDARVDQRRQLADRVVLLSADHRAQAVVDRRLPRRPLPELVEAAQQRVARPPSLMPVPGLLKVSTVVVPPCAAASVSWRNRSGCSASGSRRWVWTSITPGSTSSPVASMTSAPWPRASGTDALDAPIGDGDVGDDDAVRRHHGAAGDDHVSRRSPPVPWVSPLADLDLRAPSQSTRRPISRAAPCRRSASRSGCRQAGRRAS